MEHGNFESTSIVNISILQWLR